MVDGAADGAPFRSARDERDVDRARLTAIVAPGYWRTSHVLHVPLRASLGGRRGEVDMVEGRPLRLGGAGPRGRHECQKDQRESFQLHGASQVAWGYKALFSPGALLSFVP